MDAPSSDVARTPDHDGVHPLKRSASWLSIVVEPTSTRAPPGSTVGSATTVN